jgi:DNA mismatch endonuclease (patch repair protein)
MAQIRGKNTKPELWIRQFIWSNGLRYRLHAKNLPGTPDLVLKKWNAAIFVHGCFWHHHDECPLFKLPSTRQDFWREKLESNARRDAASVNKLTSLGWRVLIVWECAMRFDAVLAEEQTLAWITTHHKSSEIAWERIKVVTTHIVALPNTDPQMTS